MSTSGMPLSHHIEQCIISDAALPAFLSSALEAAHQDADMTSKYRQPMLCNALNTISKISSCRPACMTFTQPEAVQQNADMTIKHNDPCYQMGLTQSQTSAAVGPPASLSRTLGLRSRRQAHCSWGSRVSGVSKPGRGEGSFIRHDTAPSRSLSQLSTAAPVIMS